MLCSIYIIQNNFWFFWYKYIYISIKVSHIKAFACTQTVPKLYPKLRFVPKLLSKYNIFITILGNTDTKCIEK